MKQLKKIGYYSLLSCSLLIASCSIDNDDDEQIVTKDLRLNLNGLENLGSDYLYEGWIIVNGAPVSTGTFSVDDEGKLSKSRFTMMADVLESASKFVLTIEPVPDASPLPADTKLFVGEFNGNSATVSTGTVAPSFDTVKGEYILAAPTGTGADNEMYSGVWFLNNSSGSPVAGLDLPTLEAGWKYEGWVVIDGVPLSTGTFTSTSVPDDATPFSGDNSGPPFPGEDFLKNAPSGIEFPTDLRGKTVVISIEPSPDNSLAPFTLKPLVGMVPTDATGVQTLDSKVSGFPSGNVTR
ncbi:MAG: anti-sigma factor [Cellulophaga sp.]